MRFLDCFGLAEKSFSIAQFVVPTAPHRVPLAAGGDMSLPSTRRSVVVRPWMAVDWVGVSNICHQVPIYVDLPQPHLLVLVCAVGWGAMHSDWVRGQ